MDHSFEYVNGRRMSNRVRRSSVSLTQKNSKEVNHSKSNESTSSKRTTRSSNRGVSYTKYYTDSTAQEPKKKTATGRKLSIKYNKVKRNRSISDFERQYSEDEDISDQDEVEKKKNGNRNRKKSKPTKSMVTISEEDVSEVEYDEKTSEDKTLLRITRSQSKSTSKTVTTTEETHFSEAEESSSEFVNKTSSEKLNSTAANELSSDEDIILHKPTQTIRLRRNVLESSYSENELLGFEGGDDVNRNSHDDLTEKSQGEEVSFKEIQKVTINLTSMVKFDKAQSSSDDSKDEEGLKTNGRVSKNLLPMNATQLLPYRIELNVKDTLNLPSLEAPVNQIGYPTFENQLQEVIQSITLPLQYPEICQNFKVKSCPGLLLHGPPGTGKTTFARHLAHHFTHHSQFKVAYFHMNASDLLSKNTGESERNLVKIFHSMQKWAPSILFIDEIDGLIPVRNDKDRPSASLVATFLTLMDGILPNSSITVIGATNRPNSIDPAFRRPGRFSQEYHFKLPNLETRLQILRSLTASWPNFEPPQELFEQLGYRTNGFSNADLKALTNQAAIKALNRNYPNLITKSSTSVLNILDDNLEVISEDFDYALQDLKPSTSRSEIRPVSDLPQHFRPLLDDKVIQLVRVLEAYFEGYDSTNEGTCQASKLTLLLKACGPVASNYLLSQLTSKLVDTEVTYLDPIRNSSENDRNSINYLQNKLDISKSRATHLFVVRDVSQLSSDPRWGLTWTYLRCKVDQTGVAGKIAVMLVANDDTPTLIRPSWFKFDGDKFNQKTLFPFLSQLLEKNNLSFDLYQKTHHLKVNSLEAKLRDLDIDLIIKKVSSLFTEGPQPVDVSQFLDNLISKLSKDEFTKTTFMF